MQPQGGGKQPAAVAFELVTPAHEGGNLDHDASAPVVHIELPLHNRFERRGRVGVFLPDTDSPVSFTKLEPADRALIREAARLYRSQRVLLALLRLRADRSTLAKLGEPQRVAPLYDFLARPAGEPCGYEVARIHRSRFDRWQRAVWPLMESGRTGHV